MPSVPVTITGVLTWSGTGNGAVPGEPSHPIYYPPSVWPSPGYPSHPIAPGGPPPSVWPSPGYPAHPIAPGGLPPEVWPDPGQPAHPIAGPPPGIWPSPGVPTHPIVIPDPPVVPEGKALLIVYVPGQGYTAVVIAKPGPPGNMPPATQPVG
jgi:hypothetical protein